MREISQGLDFHLWQYLPKFSREKRGSQVLFIWQDFFLRIHFDFRLYCDFKIFFGNRDKHQDLFMLWFDGKLIQPFVRVSKNFLKRWCSDLTKNWNKQYFLIDRISINIFGEKIQVGMSDLCFLRPCPNQSEFSPVLKHYFTNPDCTLNLRKVGVFFFFFDIRRLHFGFRSGAPFEFKLQVSSTSFMLGILK